MKITIHNEAPRVDIRGIFSPLLRREQNPSEAENSSHSFTGLRPRFSAKGDEKSGQTILEAVIALAAILIILAAVSVSVVTSINNSSFIKNQGLANKYAQEGIEYIRNAISSDTSSTSYYNDYVTNLVGSERCFGPITSANPIGSACGSSSGVNIPSVSPQYIRTIKFEEGQCTGGEPFVDGLVVTVTVYWSSGKCPSTNTFCHKQATKTCFIDPAVAAPTPGI